MSAGEGFGQGARYEGSDPELLQSAIEAAFDYRGDVTLILERGEELKGYVSNRRLDSAPRYVEILLPDEPRPRRVPLESLRGVAFTGKDTASGKSWETWLRKYRAKMEAEARGEKVESIGLFPAED